MSQVLSQTIAQTIQQIDPPDPSAMERAQKKWNAVAKPLGSLGVLEDMVIRMAGIFGREDFSLAQKCVVVMCADNGVVAEGVTQTGQAVTAAVARNMALGRSSVCKMARIAGARVYPVDIGMANPVIHPNLDSCNIARGTANLLHTPAMTEEETLRAIDTGIRLARKLAGEGVTLLATGEMGIGNTTTSAAVLSVLLDRPVETVTGRGAGLSSAGLQRKIQVITQAITTHHPDRKRPLEVLATLGGLDLAGLTGLCLGAAACRVPVLLDGVISAAAALLAVGLCPSVQGYLLASHCSAEPAGRLALEALHLRPLLYADLRLGEGTGAVAVMPMLDMAMEVYHGDTFGDISIEAYQPL